MKRITVTLLLLAIVPMAGCRIFLGTPAEEIERKGDIELLPSGDVNVRLRGWRVRDFDMYMVVCLCRNHPEYKQIRALDVSRSNITDEGLDKLHGLRSLEVLDLRRTDVSDAAVMRFKERFPECRVVRE